MRRNSSVFAESRFMKLPVMLAWLIFATSTLSAQQTPDPIPHFLFESTIEIDSSAVVGSINSISIGMEYMVVTDMLGKLVFKIDFRGDVTETLSAESCLPGHDFAPLSTRIHDGGIVVTSSGAPILSYSQDGVCHGVIDREILPVATWDIDEGGRMFRLNDTNSLLTVLSLDGLEEAVLTVRTPEFPQVERRWEGGGLLWSPAGVYVLGVIPDTLFVIDPDSFSISRYPLPRTVLKSYGGQDLPAKVSPAFFTALKALLTEATVVTSLFLLNDEVLMVVYRSAEEKGFGLFTTTGLELGYGVLSNRSYKLVGAKHNKLYVAYQPPINEETGEIPNPQILVYQYE